MKNGDELISTGIKNLLLKNPGDHIFNHMVATKNGVFLKNFRGVNSIYRVISPIFFR